MLKFSIGITFPEALYKPKSRQGHISKATSLSAKWQIKQIEDWEQGIAEGIDGTK